MDAIDEYTATTSLKPTTAAHLACAESLLLLAQWLGGLRAEEKERRAVMALAFHALRAAGRIHYMKILGIVAAKEGI